MAGTTGKIKGVNGNMITVAFDGTIKQNEVAFARLGDVGLMCEVVRVRGEFADMQVFEDTSGLAVGDDVGVGVGEGVAVGDEVGVGVGVGVAVGRATQAL